MINLNQMEAFIQALKEAQHIVFFGGAGVSTESGIPDFRSANGIFMQKTGLKYQPEQIISHSFYKQFPIEYFDFHFDKLVYEEAKPNIAHTFLKDLEDLGKRVSIVTQNIDGLHQIAGSTEVYELHGNVFEYYCENCGKMYHLNQIQKDAQGIPRCKQDQGIVRPNIVMYEESLNSETILKAINVISQADLLIVAGTSLVVYPAASFVDYFRGKHFIVINKSPLTVSRNDAIVFETTISSVFEQINLEAFS